MKKSWVFFCFFILLFLIVGIFLPAGVPPLSVIRKVNCREGGAYRVLTEDTCWERWWPQGKPVSQPFCGTDRHPFIYGGYSYQVTGVLPDGIAVLVQQGDFGIATRLSILPVAGTDSVALQWEGHFAGSSNPLERIRAYRRARAIRAGMAGILANLDVFLRTDRSL